MQDVEAIAGGVAPFGVDRNAGEPDCAGSRGERGDGAFFGGGRPESEGIRVVRFYFPGAPDKGVDAEDT